MLAAFLGALQLRSAHVRTPGWMETGLAPRLGPRNKARSSSCDSACARVGVPRIIIKPQGISPQGFVSTWFAQAAPRQMLAALCRNQPPHFLQLGHVVASVGHGESECCARCKRLAHFPARSLLEGCAARLAPAPPCLDKRRMVEEYPQFIHFRRARPHFALRPCNVFAILPAP